MNAEMKQIWLEALRSGKYQQGKMQLHGDGKFCCLGVLCDLVDSKRWESKPGTHALNFDGSEGYPPDWVLSSVGLDVFDGSDPEDTENDEHPVRVVARMNDDGFDFKAIADHIEANL